MNQKLNKMLDKYELLSNRGRQQAIINNPHKMFTREIETNNRILTTQA